MKDSDRKDMEDPIRKEPPSPIQVTDRRHRFGEDASEATIAAEPAPRYPSFVAELKERSLSAESKLAEALNLLRRREAEADDFRARLRREMERRSRTEMENWLKELLEVLDSLDRGIGAAGTSGSEVLRDGLSKVRDQFLLVLSRHGVQPMALVGTIYDPHLAEAVALSPATPEDDSRVLEEIRPGYTLGGQVLRPAQVRVARSSIGAVSGAGSGKASPTEA
ncbi:MAG: nucleotide exchange factor GrpE [Acidobacteria bacterium]|nr:nucleotide exchange factor GrpE [Acidobacteriota bacterium]